MHAQACRSHRRCRCIRDAWQLRRLRAAATESLPAVRDLAIRGTGVLAGCDGLVPGFCLHDELQALTETGLSPLQALQTATINAATYLGRETLQGTIETDKRADLVLLDADPLLDIRNTRRVAAVVVRGRLISRTEIDRILAAHRR
jgi:imidazolonepropionase-like amidohydrolase